MRKFKEIGKAQQKNEDPFSPGGIEQAAFSGGEEVFYAANLGEEDAISAIDPSVINESDKGSEGIDNLALAPREINESELVSEVMNNSTLAPREINESELVSEGIDNSALASREIDEKKLVSEGIDNSALALRGINEKKLVAQGTNSTTVLAAINIDAVSKKDKFDELETDETSEEDTDSTEVGKDHTFKDLSIVGEGGNDSQLTKEGKHSEDEKPIISESNGVVPCDVDRTYETLGSFDLPALTSDDEQKVKTCLIAFHFLAGTLFFLNYGFLLDFASSWKKTFRFYIIFTCHCKWFTGEFITTFVDS